MNCYDKTIECMPREQMHALQSERLCSIVRHVYDHVEIYRQRMDALGVTPDDIRSIEDISKLPFTMKQDLRDTYPYGMFAIPLSDVVRLHASSGTTGKQIVVGYSQKDLDMWDECVARALSAAGCTKDDFVHVSYGYGLFTGGLGAHGGAQRIGATVIPVSTGNTARQIQIFRDFGSTILCCTPSYALYLIDAMKQQGLSADDISLKAGVFGAEPWTDEMRAKIEEGLGVTAYDIYGLTEVCGPGVSFNCGCQDGLHVNEDYFYPEIIDPDTLEVLPEGEQGELVFTALTKEAFPLMRYRTRDIATLTRDTCSCGRTLIRMSKPRGRTDDMLIIRGVNVFPSQIESVLMSIPETNGYYMIIVDRKNNTDTLEIQIEINPTLFASGAVKQLENLSRLLRSKIISVLGISADITFVEPNRLPRTEGKSKHVIDNRNL